METFKTLLLGISAIMILIGVVYLLILRYRGYADNKQRWIAVGLTLGGIVLIFIASKISG